MFICYICHSLLASIVLLRSHFNGHAAIGELSLPVKCCQGSCKATFATINNLIRHVRHFHGTLSSSASVFADNRATIETSSSNIVQRKDTDDVSVDWLDKIKLEGTSLVASLRAKGNIPQSAICDVVQAFNSMSESMVEHFQQVTSSTLLAAGGDESTVTTIRTMLNDHVVSVKEPLHFLSSTYKQDTYFDKHPLAVKPETVDFCPRYETSSGVSRVVYDSFQYISVKSTLRSLLRNEQLVKLLLNDRYKPGLMREFSDGKSFARHSLFNDSSKLTIMLQVFYDDMGTTNPLRGNSVMCNVGAFYYTLQNLPPYYNSCHANVHLLALCYSADLKRYGFDPVIAKFVSEINRLSTDGFCGCFPLLGQRQVFVGLCNIAGDNLALNSLFGFVESFSGDYFCTMCLCTKADVQEKFYENEFVTRTVSTYNKDIAKLESSSRLLHSRGVKKKCLLNSVHGFHVTLNFSLDPMHVLLEGIVPVELGCVLYSLCVQKKLFTIDEFNMRMSYFWSAINVDRRYRPPELSSPEEGHKIGPSMKAIQCWSLLKYMPLIIGDVVPESDPYWQFMLHLGHLVDLVFAPTFTAGMIAYLREVIADHLFTMKELYGDVCTLKPKHHLMVHFPTIIEHSGPLVGMSCMRYEMKHCFFKRCAHSMYCFRNIAKTLAYRHQQFSLYANLTGAHIREHVTVSSYSVVTVFSLPFGSVVARHFNIELTDSIFVANRLSRASVEYSHQQHIVVDIHDDGLPLFGCIQCFVFDKSSDTWALVICKCSTAAFVSHYHGYVVERSSPSLYEVVNFSDLIDHHPVCAYKKHEQTFIRLQYHVVKQ